MPPPIRARDYALYLPDADWRIASWYSGAVRLYGHSVEEALGSQSPPPLSKRQDSPQVPRLAGDTRPTDSAR